MEKVLIDALDAADHVVGRMRSGDLVTSSPRGRRVLVLDDDEQALALASRWLEISGYAPVPVQSLVDAVNAIEVCPVDGCAIAALVDWRLDDAGGKTAAPLLPMLTAARVPFSIITGWPDAPEVLALARRGVRVFGKPPKPPGFHEIINWIRSVDPEHARRA